MDPPIKNYQIPFNIILFFFLLCFNSAEAVCQPKSPSLPYLFPSPDPNCQPSSPPSSNPKPRLREIFPSPLQQPVASPRPQSSTPPSNSPSPSSLSSFLPRPFSGSPKTNPQSSLFMHSLKLSPASSPSPAAVDPSVKQLCDNTDYPDLCISSVLPFLSAKGKTSIDAFTMLEMVINACSMHAKLALAATSKLTTGRNDARRTAMAIMDCKDMYSDALDGLQSAMDAIPNKDVGTINSMLSGVISDAVTCDDGFEGQKSPFGDYNDKLRKMGSNCLAIASLIKW